MKKNISINLQGLIFHIEEDGYEVLSRYLLEVKAHFASYQGHEEIVADIEGRIAELFAARTSASKQVITLADVEEMTAKMGRVSDFQAADEDEDEAQSQATGAAAGPAPTPTAATGPRSLYRDLAHRKIAGVAAGLAQYFQVNPLWIRLGFVAPLFLSKIVLKIITLNTFYVDNGGGLAGLALLTYVILWIVLPKRLDAPTPIDTIASTGSLAGRKLFRDTDTGKIGGVAAGLAAYFRTDVTLIRVLLLLSLFVGGVGFLPYIILWIVVPEARSISEKMQMRGDAVTLSGIDDSLRATAFEGDGAAGTGSLSGRPVGAFLESAARSARPAASFLGSLIRWSVAGLLLFVAGSMLIAFTMVLGTVLGILPSGAVQLGDEQSTYFLLHDVRPWGAISGYLALAIPTLAFGLLGLRLLLRRPVLGRTASLSLVGVFLLSLVGSGVAIAQVVREFREQGSYTNVRRLAPVPGRSIVLALREQDANLRDVRLRLAPADSGAAPFVEEEYRANGASRDAARLTAQQTMQYAITQQDSTITFDEGLTLRENTPFRAQRLTLTLHLPLDKTYRLTPRFIEKLDGNDFVGGRRPYDDQPHRARLTRGGRFRLLDGRPASASGQNGDSADEDTSSAESSTDDNGEEVVNFDVNGNKMQVRVNTDGDSPSVRLVAGRFSQDPASYGTGRKTLTEPGTFNEVEAHGALRVVVRRGDTYRVEAAGRPRDLDRLRLSVSDDRLRLRSTGNDGEGLLSGFGLGGRPVLVTVTLPHLRHLDLSGACQADVTGFREDELRLEASGASTIRLADAQLTHLNLDLSGACSTELSGTATELSIDANGASQVQALGLQAQRANLDLSGISQTSVRVSEELTADLSGTSRVRYVGQPRINQDLSGTSRLEQVKD